MLCLIHWCIYSCGGVVRAGAAGVQSQHAGAVRLALLDVTSPAGSFCAARGFYLGAVKRPPFLRRRKL